MVKEEFFHELSDMYNLSIFLVITIGPLIPCQSTMETLKLLYLMIVIIPIGL